MLIIDHVTLQGGPRYRSGAINCLWALEGWLLCRDVPVTGEDMGGFTLYPIVSGAIDVTVYCIFHPRGSSGTSVSFSFDISTETPSGSKGTAA